MNMQEGLNNLIVAYAQQEGTDSGSALRDALTDLMHIAKFQGFDFDECMNAARDVFAEEVEEAK